MKKSIEDRVLMNPAAARGAPAPRPAVAAQASAGASGRWSVIRHVRLPHRDGLPLSCGGGDGVER